MATLNVLVLTYNHVNFIGPCLDGILRQKTQHTIKINVFEDCSTDGTQEVIRDYMRAYPGRITAVLNEKNVGRSKGIQHQVNRGVRSLDGDYIAVIEGDDFWSDDTKIERQIAALEANPDFMASAHNVIKVYEDRSLAPHRFIYTEEDRVVYQIEDLISMTRFFHISTLVFRNVHLRNNLSYFRKVKSKWCCDIYFNMMFTQFGRIFYIRRDMSVYRAHAGGNFSGMSDINGRMWNIESLVRYNFWLRGKFFKEFSFTVHRLIVEMMRLVDAGELPALPWPKRLKFRLLSRAHAWVYEILDRRPMLDPAVWLYGQRPKPSRPLAGELKRYFG